MRKFEYVSGRYPFKKYTGISALRAFVSDLKSDQIVKLNLEMRMVAYHIRSFIWNCKFDMKELKRSFVWNCKFGMKGYKRNHPKST